jgi:hypothetical protein
LSSSPAALSFPHAALEPVSPIERACVVQTSEIRGIIEPQQVTFPANRFRPQCNESDDQQKEMQHDVTGLYHTVRDCIFDSLMQTKAG